MDPHDNSSKPENQDTHTPPTPPGKPKSLLEVPMDDYEYKGLRIGAAPEEIQEAIEAWIDMRITKKNKPTQYALKIAMKKLY